MDVAAWRVAVGARIKSLRQNPPYDYTRRDLVRILKRMYAVSVTESQIEKIESGKSFPGYELLRILREHFETNFDFLLASEATQEAGYPDVFHYPELRNFWNAMRAVGLDEKEALRHLRRAADHLRVMAEDLRPESITNRTQDDPAQQAPQRTSRANKKPRA